MAIFRDVQIQGENFEVVVETLHPGAYGEILACTAVHEQGFARRIGGTRFVEGAAPNDRRELGELAAAMTWKSALAAIPADGEKTIVYCPKGLPQPAEMAKILVAHLAELTKADPGVILGPDIECNEVVMTHLARDHGLGDHVSGLLEGEGGLSVDGHGYTARGLEAALLAAAKHRQWDLTRMRATVQGFGAVGAHIAMYLSQHGITISAVSTAYGALIATNSAGLDIGPLFANWKAQGDKFFKHYQEAPPLGSRFADQNSLFDIEADIFIPAARTDVLAMPGEPQIQSGARNVQQFADTTGVKVVLEGANHPLTDEAESYLESRGVFILPDYLVNCGGLVVCWADWVYRSELIGDDEKAWRERLSREVSRYIARVVERNVPRVLAATEGKSEGVRKATHALARALRDEFRAEFTADAADHSKNGDGRAFARLRMDKLLS